MLLTNVDANNVDELERSNDLSRRFVFTNDDDGCCNVCLNINESIVLLLFVCLVNVVKNLYLNLKI